MGAYGSPELWPPERETRRKKGAVKRFFKKFFKVLFQFILGMVLGLVAIAMLLLFLKLKENK